MELKTKFNKMTIKEYVYSIDNHKKYTNFNTLGLYRSLLENDKLSIEDKIYIRDYAHRYFKKSFDFLQLKDPETFVKVEYLGVEMTKADERQIWNDLAENQMKMLNDKQLNHRNFGVYSKHSCGDINCPYNGLMIKKGSQFVERSICFDSDKAKSYKKAKSQRLKVEKRNFKNKSNE